MDFRWKVHFLFQRIPALPLCEKQATVYALKNGFWKGKSMRAMRVYAVRALYSVEKITKKGYTRLTEKEKNGMIVLWKML